MKNGKAYLVGAMTKPIESHVSPGTSMLGIRFKSAAFSAFYHYSSLHEMTDDSVEFDKALTPDLSLLKTPAEGLNKIFLDRLTRPKHALFAVLEDIRMCHGLVRVEALAKRHFTTVRQLERHFNYYIGVSPKEFINQARFRRTLQRLSRRRSEEGLADIAFECGYYDHSHLILEMKKYTGEVPGK
jgi:AraC-like DNA-binding protein